jgi:hypothetical protein
LGARFSALVQNGPGAHPDYYTMGNESFPWTKRPGRGVDYPIPSSVEVKKRVELYFCSTSGFLRHVNFLNAELNSICHLLALLGAHHILHVSRIRVKV